MIEEIECKRYKPTSYVKNGFVRGLQRYRCKDCGCNFTNTDPRGKPPAMKALAVLLYGACNTSLSMIERLLDVSHVSVYRWIRQEASSLEALKGPEDVEIVEIDEIWHFMNGKKQSLDLESR